MKQFRLMILAIVTSWMATACGDFLEEKSQDEVIPTTATDFREILLNYQQVGFSPVVLVMDDDVMIDESQYWGTSDNYYATAMQPCFTWQPDMWERLSTTYSDRYSSMYECIKAMNAILEEIDDANGTPEEKDMVKAQALGTRAYYYFMLVNMFGEPYNYNKDALGVVLKFESTYTDAGMSRATVAEVYEQVVEDLENASAILNKYPKQRGDYLMNCTAADILLSRVYLYMEEWEKAVTAADRAIETAEGLFDYTTLPTGQRFYMTSYENSEVEWLPSLVSMPASILTVSDGLSSLFGSNDRRAEFLRGDYSGIGKVLVNGTGPNVMVRAAEAYLNRAEAKAAAETPDVAGALADLNELRRHRITGYSDVNITDAATLLDEIRNERRKELCYEGHRWFDLRRYGMPSISHDFRTKTVDPRLRYTLQEKDPLYTLPIPNSMIESNVKLEQNASASAPERGGVAID